jgi:hypothetical protein
MQMPFALLKCIKQKKRSPMDYANSYAFFLMGGENDAKYINILPHAFMSVLSIKD